VNPGGRSPWAVDWIGNPRSFSARSATSLVDLFVSPMDERLPGPKSQVRLTVEFQELASLRPPEKPPKNKRPTLRTRGKHFALEVDPSSSTICELLPKGQKPGSKPIPQVGGWPYYMEGEAREAASSAKLVAIADRMGVDPFFCVIPCMEIVRHFFCTSSHLARQLLFGWEDLVQREHCSFEYPRAVVRLNPGLGTSFEDGATLAQYAISGWWREAADAVRRSQQQTDSKVRPSLACSFPLRDECTILVEALRVRTRTLLGSRFFVTQIVHAPKARNMQDCWVSFEPRDPHVIDFVPKPWRPAPVVELPETRLVCARW
jgi:hypothetical protein